MLTHTNLLSMYNSGSSVEADLSAAVMHAFLCTVCNFKSFFLRAGPRNHNTVSQYESYYFSVDPPIQNIVRSIVTKLGVQPLFLIVGQINNEVH